MLESARAAGHLDGVGRVAPRVGAACPAFSLRDVSTSLECKDFLDPRTCHVSRRERFLSRWPRRQAPRTGPAPRGRCGRAARGRALSLDQTRRGASRGGASRNLARGLLENSGCEPSSNPSRSARTRAHAIQRGRLDPGAGAFGPSPAPPVRLGARACMTRLLPGTHPGAGGRRLLPARGAPQPRRVTAWIGQVSSGDLPDLSARQACGLQVGLQDPHPKIALSGS
jgi:hypothetical protein